MIQTNHHENEDCWCITANSSIQIQEAFENVSWSYSINHLKQDRSEFL